VDTISRATLYHVSTSHGLIGVPTLSYEDRRHSEENCAVPWQCQQGHCCNEITRFDPGLESSVHINRTLFSTSPEDSGHTRRPQPAS
jgi:hypothetical protein